MTINLFKALKEYLKTFKIKDKSTYPTDECHKQSNKFFEGKIPNFGSLLNDFISYIDKMPNEVSF